MQRRKSYLWHYADHAVVILCAQARGRISFTSAAGVACFCEERFGETRDAKSTPDCEELVWVEKKGKTLKSHFRCQSVGTVDFSMGSEAKSTSAQPSTNIPIQCPECGTKPMAQFFWKYKGSLAARALDKDDAGGAFGAA